MELQVKQEELGPLDGDGAIQNMELKVKQEEEELAPSDVDGAMSGVDGALRWALSGVRRLKESSVAELGEDTLSRLQGNLSKLQLSSDFSGLGGMEEAVRHIRLAVSQEAGVALDTLKVKVTHAGDIGEVAQSVLRAHCGDTAPHCIFTDIVARVPAKTKRALQSLMLKRDGVAQRAVAKGAALPAARAKASQAFLSQAGP